MIKMANCPEGCCTEAKGIPQGRLTKKMNKNAKIEKLNTLAHEGIGVVALDRSWTAGKESGLSLRLHKKAVQRRHQTRWEVDQENSVISPLLP